MRGIVLDSRQSALRRETEDAEEEGINRSRNEVSVEK